jgi:hypothetical protein
MLSKNNYKQINNIYKINSIKNKLFQINIYYNKIKIISNKKINISFHLFYIQTKNYKNYHKNNKILKNILLINKLNPKLLINFTIIILVDFILHNQHLHIINSQLQVISNKKLYLNNKIIILLKKNYFINNYFNILLNLILNNPNSIL